jgi:hypothetical protein
MDRNHLLALRLIECGRGLTERGNVIVSAAARSLLRFGLIEYAANRWAGYKLTKAGRLIIARKDHDNDE